MTDAENIILQTVKVAYFDSGIDWREFWLKGIPYRVSRCGSLQTRLKSTGGGIVNLGEWVNKKLYCGTTDDFGGYYMMTSVASFSVRMHRLMVLCFVGAIPVDLEVNHIDGNRENNTLENLEIVSHYENMSNMKLRSPTIKKRSSGKVTREIFNDVLVRIKNNETNKAIASAHDLDPSTISRIRHSRVKYEFDTL